MRKTAQKSLISKPQYQRLYDAVECVVDLPDLDRCVFIPIPFDCCESEIFRHIPTDPLTESMGFIDDEQIVVLETVNGNFLHQQQLVVWTSLPSNGPRPELNRLDWLYHFLTNRPQRAIVRWRNRCWQVEKTQRSIPVIKRLLRWERKCHFLKFWICFSPLLNHEHYMLSALRYALDGRDHYLDNTSSLAMACGVRIRLFRLRIQKDHPNPYESCFDAKPRP